MKIALGSDHAGYEQKLALLTFLMEKGHEVDDLGTFTTDSCDYPDYAHPVAGGVNRGSYEAGILICGSANGVAMTANKYQQVRAAICWNREIAELARQHNDANILCIPARYVSILEGLDLADIFLSTDFEGGRHLRRVEKIPL
jgi:ribose 5-phosphate isomerase B